MSSLLIFSSHYTFSINQDHPRNANPPKRNNNADLIIFHQNIRGLYNKIDEPLYFWTIEFPPILCFTEHHLRDHEINNTCTLELNIVERAVNMVE